MAEWFAPKRFGYGCGFPITWQGWALTAAYLLVVVGAGLAMEERPLLLLPIVLPATALFLLIAARTTRGGWRWRWGERA